MVVLNSEHAVVNYVPVLLLICSNKKKAGEEGVEVAGGGGGGGGRGQRQVQRRTSNTNRKRQGLGEKIKSDASKCIKMSYGHYKYLAVNKNGLHLLTKLLRI